MRCYSRLLILFLFPLSPLWVAPVTSVTEGCLLCSKRREKSFQLRESQHRRTIFVWLCVRWLSFQLKSFREHYWHEFSYLYFNCASLFHLEATQVLQQLLACVTDVNPLSCQEQEILDRYFQLDHTKGKNSPLIK